MDLSKFKEILLRKSSDLQLHTLIRNMSDDNMFFLVEESLEKMSSRKKPNLLLRKWASKLRAGGGRLDANMIYDSLSHHASQYKAALKANNEKVANQHGKTFHTLLHLVSKLKSAHYGDYGGIKVDHVNPKPWQASYYKVSGSGKSKAKGIGHGGSGESLGTYAYYRHKPSVSHLKEDSKEEYKDRYYPFEETKVNGRYINVDDNAKFDGEYKPDVFEQHPVFKVFRTPGNKLSKESIEKYSKEFNDFYDRKNPDSAINKYINFRKSMGDAYQTRGAEMAATVHDDSSKDKPYYHSEIKADLIPEHLRGLVSDEGTTGEQTETQSPKPQQGVENTPATPAPAQPTQQKAEAIKPSPTKSTKPVKEPKKLTEQEQALLDKWSR
jgi:hypothetical protein